jgi:hypothetical protein
MPFFIAVRLGRTLAVSVEALRERTVVEMARSAQKGCDAPKEAVVVAQHIKPREQR